MRRSVIYALLLAAIAAISGAYFFRHSKGQQPANSSGVAGNPQQGAPAIMPSDSTASSVSTDSAGPGERLAMSTDSQVATTNAPSSQSSTRAEKQRVDHESVVSARADELMDLAMTDDPTALKTIVGELNNGDPDIRRAAIEATVQYGDSNAIPWLEAAAQWAQTTDEKTEINEAIDFLKLPKLESRTEGQPVAKPKTVTPRK